jgi:hypothetical protein
LFLALFGWWRGTAVGPQLQVPMFYDDHYIYPRPWTQAQEAPGVPDPAPAAVLYGPNRISQPFASASDRPALIELWLAGTAGTEVELSLKSGSGSIYRAVLPLEAGDGRYYRLSIPENSSSRNFILTLAAPGATADNPVLTRVVGGDRLGGSLLINEYLRPGNIELYTYERGSWLNSLGEQLLPAVFRLRLQQYKPELFKGAAFPVLLALTASTTVVFLLLAAGGRVSPESRQDKSYIPELVMIFWAAFLIWQLAGGRLHLPGFIQPVHLQSRQTALAVAPAPDGQPRVVHDFSQQLWTAVRKPEARFISTGILDGLPAIHVPGDSAIEYSLTIPFDGRLRLGMGLQEGSALRFSVLLAGQPLHTQLINDSDGRQWLDLDLTPWSGQAGLLVFRTENMTESQAAGYWLMPQLLSRSGWLLAGPLQTVGPIQDSSYRFGESVILAGYQVEEMKEQLVVTLYWQPVAALDDHATIFVHLLDDSGNIVAQHDGPPVSGVYPLTAWQSGTIIADRHVLALPAETPPQAYQLAVGLYDPATLIRWPVAGLNGESLPDGRALLVVPE